MTKRSTSRWTIAGTLLAMFLAALGVDFLFNAGLLRHFYVNAGPALLSQAHLIRRIPFGYASILLTLGLELWLLLRINVSGAGGGVCFGAVFGGVIGIAGALGLFSIAPLRPDFLAGLAVYQILEYAVAGALAGSAIASGHSRKAILIGFVILVAGFIAALALQAASTQSR